MAEAGVGERFGEQQGIAEFVFEALFEWIHAGRSRTLSTCRSRRQTPSLAHVAA
jgi:hypothetical protein